MGCIAVIDIGKTNAKLALVDPGSLRETHVRKRPNTVIDAAPYPHYGIEGIWSFLTGALAELGQNHPIDAISVTTHGATAALVDAGGALVLPVLDYEHDGPEELAAQYDRVRPPFVETGSPRLPMGLNLGAQLFWQFRSFPEAARAAHILTYPQYWAMRLCGVAASEVTSLGCHTDLWNPHAGSFSTLVEAMGWRALFPPIRGAADVLGPIRPDLARRLGLPSGIPVHCGIHDSNASLYPHLRRRSGAFSVVSTGTWTVSMAVGGAAVRLDPARDTLINVNALGQAVPSARFMGGREYELIRDGQELVPSESDEAAVSREGLMLLPSVVPGCGPFPNSEARWQGSPRSPGQRAVALSRYLAMMTATCLEMIGARGPVLVEGPFAANDCYLRMLATACARPVAALGGSLTGTSAGTALLALGRLPATSAQDGRAFHSQPALTSYAASWREAAAEDRLSV